MAEGVLEIEFRGATAWVWMNRPAVHNALNEELIDALAVAFRSFAEEEGVRAVVLSGKGKSFSAGADAETMRRQGEANPLKNLENARALAEVFRAIAFCPKPTIACVNGAAIGGGLGLVSACDVAIASSAAVFATSEVRLGLIPATISPYVVRAVGPRWARRLFLTGERISAVQAEKIGLVHETAEPEEIDAKVDAVIGNLLAGAPGAQKASKELIDAIAGEAIARDLIEDTAVRIAAIRSEPEAQEGLRAFLEKRPASWVPQR
jgi:methylglutaconyl-CoA hydratase